MKCFNCEKVISGPTEEDVEGNLLCFTCWYDSTLASGETITCQKCFGLRQIDNPFKLGGVLETCEKCKGTGKIPKANVEKVAFKECEKIYDSNDIEDCPF